VEPPRNPDKFPYPAGLGKSARRSPPAARPPPQATTISSIGDFRTVLASPILMGRSWWADPSGPFLMDRTDRPASHVA